MLKWIAQNKYKLMLFMIGLYLVTDAMLHKGQTRTLFPKNFPALQLKEMLPQSKSVLINKNKNWQKGINTKEQITKLPPGEAGFECDVYFDSTTRFFDVHHDANKKSGFSLKGLLELYQQNKLQASVWLDIKNLNNSNAAAALQTLTELREKYQLYDKIIVESHRAELLTAFSDSGFYTSYYVPFFNPYKINDAQIKLWADSIAAVAVKAKLNALSGYYFQSSFLSQYFPKYSVLTWVDDNPFSVVNYFFQKKIESDKSVFIVLKP